MWYKKMQIRCGLPSITEAGEVHVRMLDARQQILMGVVTRENMLDHFYEEGTPAQRTPIKELLIKVLDGIERPQTKAPQPPS